MEPGQRLYIVFSSGRRLRFLSHLDMMRLWERALRRAALPLRYSQGFHPHPRLSLAMPLAVGMTADAEWLECEMRQAVPVDEVALRLCSQLPEGIGLCQVQQADWRAPALAARVRESAYQAQVRRPPPLEDVRHRVRRFLEAASWPVEEQRKGRVRAVDLREVVTGVEEGSWDEERRLMRFALRHEGGQSARIETILAAWGLGPDVLLHRRWLSFAPPGE